MTRHFFNNRRSDFHAERYEVEVIRESDLTGFWLCRNLKTGQLENIHRINLELSDEP